MTFGTSVAHSMNKAGRPRWVASFQILFPCEPADRRRRPLFPHIRSRSNGSVWPSPRGLPQTDRDGVALIFRVGTVASRTSERIAAGRSHGRTAQSTSAVWRRHLSQVAGSHGPVCRAWRGRWMSAGHRPGSPSRERLQRGAGRSMGRAPCGGAIAGSPGCVGRWYNMSNPIIGFACNACRQTHTRVGGVSSLAQDPRSEEDGCEAIRRESGLLHHRK